MLQHNKLVNDTMDWFKKRNLFSKKKWLNDSNASIRKPLSLAFFPKYICGENNQPRKTSNKFNQRLYIWNLTSTISVLSYIKSANHFIDKNHNFLIPPNSLLATMNMKALYISIINKKRIVSVKKKYDQFAYRHPLRMKWICPAVKKCKKTFPKAHKEVCLKGLWRIHCEKASW